MIFRSEGHRIQVCISY